MKWKERCFCQIEERIKDSEVKSSFNRSTTDFKTGIHLAIFKEPFLSLVLNGSKKIECRLTQKKISPFNNIYTGDYILIQDNQGFIQAIGIAGQISFISNLNPNKLELLINQYSVDICKNADSLFFESKYDAKFCSLISLDKVIKIDPVKSGKNSRLSWLTIKKGIPLTFLKN